MKKVAVGKAVNAYRMMTGQNFTLAKMTGKAKFAVVRALGKLKLVAADYDAFLEEASKRLRPEGYEEIAKKIQGGGSLTEADRIPGYANFGFDAHMMDIYPTLMAGATLYVLDEELRHDLDALHTFFEDKRITAAFLTTQIAWQLTSLYEFPSLRWLAGGGEKMPQMQSPAAVLTAL